MIVPIVAASIYQYELFLREFNLRRENARYITSTQQLRGLAGVGDNHPLFLLEGYQYNFSYKTAFFQELNYHVLSERFMVRLVPDQHLF